MSANKLRAKSIPNFHSLFGKLPRFFTSAQPPAKKTAGLIEKETEVSYDLYGIRLRAKSVCMRFNLILFVLVLVLVLEIRIL
jgi:hypothetical protein